MSQEQKNRDFFSPLSGMIVLFSIIAGILILVTIGVVSFRKINQNLLQITEEKPLRFLAENAKYQKTFEKKFSHFSQKTNLTLNRKDLNFALQEISAFQNLRKIFFVEKMEEEMIFLKISLPIRTGLIRRKTRFLNGTAEVIPHLKGEKVLFNFQKIQKMNGEIVPPYLKNSLSPYSLFFHEKSLPPLSSALPFLEKLEIQKNQILLTFSKDKNLVNPHSPQASSPPFFLQYFFFFLLIPFLFFLFRKKM